MPKTFLLILIFLLADRVCWGQYSDIKSFVPRGFTILDSASGDLNRDGKRDVVLVLRNQLEKESMDTARPLLLLMGNGKGRYKLIARNDHAVLCLGCGGVFGDPYEGITVNRTYFSIEHYGGSSWRWTRVITFKFDLQSKQFVLHRDAGYSWRVSNPEKQDEHLYSAVDFDSLPFERYSYEKEM